MSVVRTSCSSRESSRTRRAWPVRSLWWPERPRTDCSHPRALVGSPYWTPVEIWSEPGVYVYSKAFNGLMVISLQYFWERLEISFLPVQLHKQSLPTLLGMGLTNHEVFCSYSMQASTRPQAYGKQFNYTQNNYFPPTCMRALVTMPRQESVCCFRLILRASSCRTSGCQSGWGRDRERGDKPLKSL